MCTTSDTYFRCEAMSTGHIHVSSRYSQRRSIQHPIYTLHSLPNHKLDLCNLVSPL